MLPWSSCDIPYQDYHMLLLTLADANPMCPPPGVDKWFANGGGNYFSPAFSVARAALPRVPLSTLLYGEKGY